MRQTVSSWEDNPYARSQSRSASPRLEDDGPIAVKQHTILAMPLDGAGKDAALDLRAEALEGFHVIFMRHTDHVLLDDWILLELRGDVVCGRSDQFYSRFGKLVDTAMRRRMRARTNDGC